MMGALAPFSYLVKYTDRLILRLANNIFDYFSV
jgi:hypothetical protein